ncbi:hypothetical protein NFHSH190041_07890 [Shewanella sp. NFH-SH190041]|nr:hypothetical protein NFHSH190041_07890 [Shewanella sp. NFH-SH190041]
MNNMASRQQDENYSSDGAIFKRDTCNAKEATTADGMCHLDASATVTAPTIAGLSGIRARPAPATLINRLGQPHFGYFAEPVAQFSLPQFVYRTEMDGSASAWARYFHYKQFQFVALQGADFLLGMALADIRYLGSGFVYLYDMTTNHLTELNFLQPLGGRYATSPSPVNGHGYIRARQGQLALTLS